MSWLGLREVRLHAFGGGRGRCGVERGNREQLIDRRRLGGALGEAVARGQGGQLEGGNAIDEPIEMFADAGVGAGPLRRFEQHFERLIESCLRARQMAEGQLRSALFEVAIGSGEQFVNGIDRGGCGDRGWRLRDEGAGGVVCTGRRPRTDEHATLTQTATRPRARSADRLMHRLAEDRGA